MATTQRRFEIDDTVVLRGHGSDLAEPHLLGRVERTYHALDSHDPLEDCLIIAYQPVDTDILRRFTSSGRPPKGYLFVEFAHEEAGHALLPEESVTLLSRAHALGDTVKQDPNSPMFGTIIDVKSSYVLAPICQRSSVLGVSPEVKFADWLNTLPSRDDSRLAFDFSNLASFSFLYGINGDEIRRAEDFQSGDHVVSCDWFGVVEASDIDVAVLLDNKTVVWVEKPWELEIVVSNPYGKPLVSMPEFDDIRRPDILNVHRNGVTSMPSKRLGRGDAVVTNRRNIEKGRWLKGQYDPNASPQGRVLDVRTRRLDINWLVPNAFVDSAHEHMPPVSMRPYQNLTSFRNARDLRPRKDLVRYDHDRKPAVEDAIRSSKHAVSSGDPFYPGDRVRFRGVTENKSKHEGESTSVNGSNNGDDQGRSLGTVRGTAVSESRNVGRDVIPRSETYDFDLNEYMVCVGYHEAAVLWQDGSTSQLDSTQLIPYSLPESDLCPGDLVMAKEGLRMTALDAEGAPVTSEFNEMSFFERDHVLRPSKVGVIQSVDAQERLARVRWYADPKVKLGAYGQVLQEARFGRIGEEIEDVSLYEIMTEPALVRKRGDLVVIPPRDLTRPEALRSFPTVPQDLLATHPPGPTTLSYLRQMSSHVLPALWEIARPFADMMHPMPASHPKYDWIGEIVEIDLDGSLILRLSSMKDCKDIVISQDDILLIVDENAEYLEEPDDYMELGSNTEKNDDIYSEGSSIHLRSDDYESAIDETIEYEGGERLDNESGEDEWSTDDDVPKSDSEMIDADDTKPPTDTQMGGTGFDGATSDFELFGHLRRRRQAVDRAGHEADETATDETFLHGLMNPADAPATPVVTDSQTQTDLSSQQPSLDVPSQGVVVSMLVEHLHQRNAPTGFEVLEQMPPPDQYNRTEVPTQNPAFLKRVAKEHRILASSLPDGEIYVRTYESRLDLLRCLIVGPANTPYEYCPFVVDLHLGPNFPNEPPKAHFHSWTSGLGRINPNLYEEGKICLSLLGTWPGQSEQEGWSEKATILQVLVSLQGLVFVGQPFYNEAGFETYGEEKVYSLESQQYSEKAYVMARGFVKYALLKAPSGLEDVLAWLYLCTSDAGVDSSASPCLLLKVIERAKLLMERSTGLKQQASIASSSTIEGQINKEIFLIDGVGESSDATKTFLKPLSQGALVMLRKTMVALENIQRQYDNVTAEEI